MPLESRASRRRRRRSAAPSGSTLVPHVLVGLVVVYAVLLFAFWVIHYEGPRPSAGQVMKDFHAYLGLGPSDAAAAPPPVVTLPKPPAPAPRVAPPPPPPPTPRPVSVLDGIASTIKRVAKDSRSLKTLSRGGELETERIRLVSELTEARDALGAILDENEDDDRANGLWDRLQELLAALRKL